jgi:iron complex transport system substrate-binding protein
MRQPVRIISLISAATEMLFAIGLEGDVVGISHECDWPPQCRDLPRVTRSRIDSSAGSAAIDAEVKLLMTAGQALYEVDADLLAELQPDLIVTQSQCDVCAVRYEDVVAAVRCSSQLVGTQVLSLNPRCLVDVFNDMKRIGAAAEISDSTERAIAALLKRVDQVRSQTANVPLAERPRVAVIEWLEPLMLAGNWVPELVEIAGGRCELTPLGGHSQYHERDDILKFDPQVIVACPCGFDLPRASKEARSLSNRRGWHDLTAVKHNRVFVVDGNACFNRPGPRLVESVELLAGLIHPSRYQMPGDCQSLFRRYE